MERLEKARIGKSSVSLTGEGTPQQSWSGLSTLAGVCVLRGGGLGVGEEFS